MKLFGFVFLLLGVITYFRPKLFERFLQFSNSLKGIKTEITPNTRAFYKFVALLWIGIGTLFILGIVG